ncbi:MAG: hypothetical protein ACRES9_09855 [Gammaproteobacteria bacterium]
MNIRLLFAGLLMVICCGCATQIHPDVKSNPPPTEPLANFQHFKLMPITTSMGAAKKQAAVAKISEYFTARIGKILAGWENKNSSGRTLEVEPYIEKLKFVNGGTRFFAGAMAGSSAVLMKMKLTDEATGQVIADPEFYQRAAAYGGALTVGGTDNGMLARIATVAQEYLERNYSKAVGGPTGLDESKN